MEFEEIFYQNEERYYDINNTKILAFINSFLAETNLYFPVCEEEDNYYSLLFSLKDYVYTCYPEYISLFNQQLFDQGFSILHSLFYDMVTLGEHTNKKLPQVEKNKILLSPYIQQIHYENQKIYLEAMEKTYSFYSIFDFFRTNFDAFSYIRKNRKNLDGNCHNQSWKFIKFCSEQASLVTMLCPYLFQGSYYHSIIRDECNHYIDLANSIVYDDTIREEVLKGKIIRETKKEDLDSALELALEQFPDSLNSFSQPLVLALHKEYLSKER